MFAVDQIQDQTLVVPSKPPAALKGKLLMDPGTESTGGGAGANFVLQVCGWCSGMTSQGDVSMWSCHV